nr:uncharacterized protein LOC109163356 [Ipomoea trifida]
MHRQMASSIEASLALLRTSIVVQQDAVAGLERTLLDHYQEIARLETRHAAILDTQARTADSAVFRSISLDFFLGLRFSTCNPHNGRQFYGHPKRKGGAGAVGRSWWCGDMVEHFFGNGSSGGRGRGGGFGWRLLAIALLLGVRFWCLCLDGDYLWRHLFSLDTDDHGDAAACSGDGSRGGPRTAWYRNR